MPFNPEHLLFRAPPAIAERRVFVGYSGGLDSTVLLDALQRLEAPQLIAVHVHHGLQAVADEWVEHCAAECRSRGLPFEQLRVEVDTRSPLGPEAAAREARYAAMRGLLGSGDVLVTAHHADDQAETFLMRALRGAGPKGLGAMRALQDFGPGLLWRPLLDVTRAALSAYAIERQLRWIDDPHNHDPRFERSWLRASVLPELRQRWPSASDSLARSAALCAEADELLLERARDDAALALRGPSLSVAAVKALSLPRRHNLLRWWLSDFRGLPQPPHAAVSEIARLLEARIDAEPCVGWPGLELRRYRDELVAMAPLPPEPARGVRWHWNGVGPFAIPAGGGVLHGDRPIESAALELMFPQGGERFQPQGSAHTRSLKNLFQEHGVPPWRRRRTPLLYEDGQLRWVGGIGREAQAPEVYAGLRWEPAA